MENLNAALGPSNEVREEFENDKSYIEEVQRPLTPNSIERQGPLCPGVAPAPKLLYQVLVVSFQMEFINILKLK